MNKKIMRLFFVLCGLWLSNTAIAQTQTATEDLMRGNGKIYVVVAVCLTILVGLFVYVFLVDRKISKLEKEK